MSFIRSLKLLFITLALFNHTIHATPLHQPVKKVLLVVAMHSEAEPIIKKLHLTPLHHHFSNLPMRGYTGKVANKTILLIENGEDPINHVQNIGTQAATLSTYLGIDYFHPDLIISIGTAGAVPESGALLKDIYLSQTIYFFDRRIPMKGYDNYGLGAYVSSAIPGIDKKLGFKKGVVCSGDSFDEEAVDYKMFLKEKCSAIDMEAASVAWVSMLTKTPMIAIKGITNYVRGKQIHAEHKEYIPVVTTELANKLLELLNALS